jgi:hypothetical protein
VARTTAVHAAWSARAAASWCSVAPRVGAETRAGAGRGAWVASSVGGRVVSSSWSEQPSARSAARVPGARARTSSGTFSILTMPSGDPVGRGRKEVLPTDEPVATYERLDLPAGGLALTASYRWPCPPRGRLVQGQFRRRVRLEPFIGDRRAASHRAAIGSGTQTSFRSFDGVEALAQALDERVVDLLCREALGRLDNVDRLVDGCPVLVCRLERFIQRPFDALAFSGQELPRSVVVHRKSPFFLAIVPECTLPVAWDAAFDPGLRARQVPGSPPGLGRGSSARRPRRIVPRYEEGRPARVERTWPGEGKSPPPALRLEGRTMVVNPRH